MKPVEFSKSFEKAYAKRILRNKKLRQAFETRYYVEEDDCYRFVDIGTHAQVYGQ